MTGFEPHCLWWDKQITNSYKSKKRSGKIVWAPLDDSWFNSVLLPQILYSFEIVLFRCIIVQPKFWKVWIRNFKTGLKFINRRKFHQSFPRITWGYFRPTLAPSPILFVIKSRRDCKISPCLSSFVKIRNRLKCMLRPRILLRKFLTKLPLYTSKNFDYAKFSC